MSKGRAHKTLDELLKEYYRVKTVRESRKRAQENDKYAGLRECFRNVRRNGCTKLSYVY